MNLYNLSQYFLKLSALEFGEGTEWIHEKFKERKEFKNFPYKNAIKVFKKFGLNDFRTPINIKPNNNLEDQNIINLKQSLRKKLDELNNHLHNIFETFDKNFNDLLVQFRNYLDTFNNLLIINKNISVNNKIIFPKGMSIFKAYTYLVNKGKMLGDDYILPNLDQIQEFKDYSNAQKPTKLDLVFSTKTSDICGMGSRGIVSCQNLFGEADTDLSTRLIGAILSKYLGICYITNGSDWKGRGEKMFYRSLVRLLINFETNSLVIVVDKLYPTKNDDITKIIIEELQKRSKLPVLNIYDINLDEYFVKQELLIPEDVEDYKDNPIEKKYNLKKEIKLLTGPDPGRRLKAITNILVTDPKFVSKNIEFVSELPYPLIKNFISKSELNKIINLYDYKNPIIRELIAIKVTFKKYPNEFKKIMLDTNSNVIASLLNGYGDKMSPIPNEIFEYFAMLPENRQQFIIDSVHKDVGNKFVEYMEGIGKS